LDAQEFQNIYLSEPEEAKPYTLKSQSSNIRLSSDTLVDWTGVYTTAVKNQGRCNCSSAFGAVGKNIENYIIGIKLLS